MFAGHIGSDCDGLSWQQAVIKKKIAEKLVQASFVTKPIRLKSVYVVKLIF